MSAEMIEGKAYVGQASDLWSCGVILFALVCGYLPFEDGNTQALYQKILHARYRCPSFLSAPCKDLISKILNTDPNTRYTSAQIRQHPWFITNYSGPPDPVCVILQFSRENIVTCRARGCRHQKQCGMVTTYLILLIFV